MYKAFTIVEVLVSMVIGGLVILGAYTVYSMVLKEGMLLQHTTSELAQQRMADRVISRDVEECDAIICSPNGWRCLWSDTLEVVYDIQGDQLFRKVITMNGLNDAEGHWSADADWSSVQSKEGKSLGGYSSCTTRLGELICLPGEPADAIVFCRVSNRPQRDSACMKYYKSYDALNRFLYYAD